MRRIHLALSLIGFLLWSTVVRAGPLDKGHRILLERGLQIQAQVFWRPTGSFDLTRWRQSNFTTVNWQWSPNLVLAGPAPGVPWGRWSDPDGHYDAPTNDERPYLCQFVSLQFSDEQDLNDAAVRAAAADWFSRARGNFPNTLLYTNQTGSRVSAENMRKYMKACRPDMLCFDTYPFGRPEVTSPHFGSPTSLYQDMAIYHELALAGNDGTGERPIPCGIYTQTFKFAPKWKRFPSESEISLNMFAAWTFGFKFVSSFTYNAPSSAGLRSCLFTGFGDSAPTPAFDQMAELNRRSHNLGKSLVRLLSTKIFFIPGEHRESDGTVATNPVPSGLPTWSRGNDKHIASIAATNLGSFNDGLRGDVLVGHFRPLLEADDGPNFEDENYFMITNGLCDKDGPADRTRQRILLSFDLKDSRITGLQKLNHRTGLVEPIPLTHLTGARHCHRFQLDGGTGDLFKFDTGARFIDGRLVSRPESPSDGTPELRAPNTEQAMGAFVREGTQVSGGMATLVREGGRRLRFRDDGEGMAILMVPGTAGVHGIYDPQVKPLVDAGFRAIRFDRVGRGESELGHWRYTGASEVADAWALLDRLSVERAVLMGRSSGSGVIRAMYRKHPERVIGLISIDSASFGKVSDRPPATLLPDAPLDAGLSPRFDPDTIALYHRNKSALQKICRLWDYPSDYNTKVLLAWEVERERIRQAWEALPPDPAHKEEPERVLTQKWCRIPALVFTAGRGRIGPDGPEAVALARRLPGDDTRLVVIKNTGHFMNVEVADEFNRQLISFLCKLR